MLRPISKNELLLFGHQHFDNLMKRIEELSNEQQKTTFPEGTLNRDIADVLMHLHHWHLLMLRWNEAGMSGSKPDIPAKGYTWDTVSELNDWIWEKYHEVPLEDAKVFVQRSFQEVRNCIENHSNTALFEAGEIEWTGSTLLGSYFDSVTAHHYVWAHDLIARNTNSSSSVPPNLSE